MKSDILRKDQAPKKDVFLLSFLFNSKQKPRQIAAFLFGVLLLLPFRRPFLVHSIVFFLGRFFQMTVLHIIFPLVLVDSAGLESLVIPLSSSNSPFCLRLVPFFTCLFPLSCLSCRIFFMLLLMFMCV